MSAGAGLAHLSDIVVVAYGRTPFAHFHQRLARVTLPALGGALVRRVLDRGGIAPQDVDEVVVGANFPGIDRSIARQVAVRAGVPAERTAYTVDRACCSSLTATALAARALRCGDATVAVAGGTENLSGVPYAVHRLRFGERLGHVTLTDPLVVTCPMTGVPRAVQAGVEGLEFGVDRSAQDEWAQRSHESQARAAGRGDLDAELVPVTVPGTDGVDVALDRDECPRPNTTRDRLAALPTVYGSPTVTAGNAPNLSTGASALVLMAGATARRSGAEPLARFRSLVQLAGDPQRIASIPGFAGLLALHRAGVDLDDIHVIEINEAFAVVPLVATLVLADRDRERAEQLRTITNVNGGAIAFGHPTAATAARLVMTAISQLRQRGGGLALVSICGGIGEAEAAVIEV